MIPVNLRAQIPNEVFDYQTLFGVLAKYASPRDKISGLLRRGTIIKVKKGLYIFPESVARQLLLPSYWKNTTPASVFYVQKQEKASLFLQLVPFMLILDTPLLSASRTI